MEKLIHILPYLFIIIPILCTIVIYQIRFQLVKNNWRAIHTTVQLSALFYIAAVASLLKVLFDSYYIGSILIILIVVLAIILIFQWKKHTEVVLLKGLKILARLSFLVFGLCYVLLLIYWLVDYFYLS